MGPVGEEKGPPDSGLEAPEASFWGIPQFNLGGGAKLAPLGG